MRIFSWIFAESIFSGLFSMKSFAQTGSSAKRFLKKFRLEPLSNEERIIPLQLHCVQS